MSSCEDNKTIKEYHSNGNIKLEVPLDNKGIQNGLYKAFYEGGELKQKMNYLNGKITDTVFYYYKNGKLKEKGKIIKNKYKEGWWIYNDSLGNLIKKEEYWIRNDSVLLNQFIYFNNTSIDKLKSEYFNLKIPDTIYLGRNVAQLNFKSRFKNANEDV